MTVIFSLGQAKTFQPSLPCPCFSITRVVKLSEGFFLGLVSIGCLTCLLSLLLSLFRLFTILHYHLAVADCARGQAIRLSIVDAESRLRVGVDSKSLHAQLVLLAELVGVRLKSRCSHLVVLSLVAFVQG